MPRTKVSKSSKRNREVSSREEKIRELEERYDQFLDKLESKRRSYESEIQEMINLLVQRSSKVVLQMKMGDFLELNLKKFTDWKHVSNNTTIGAANAALSVSQSINNATLAALSRSATKLLNPNDEGYLTEDSSHGGSIGTTTSSGTLAVFTSSTIVNVQQREQQQQQQQQQQHQLRGRTPGPLNSARARRPRRSRSACGNFVHGSALKAMPSANANVSTAEAHSSRSKMRTPIAPRAKAFSADRSSKISTIMSSPKSPAAAFLRWPKPGEVVLSKCGSPIVAQMMPDSFANVNIPVRNGVLSLRPKKISELKPDLIEAIDPETLNQIKTLHANLNLIMQMANGSDPK